MILHDIYLRTVQVRSSRDALHESVRVVEAYREGGKVKQRVVADLGRKGLLLKILPKLQRLLGGDVGQEETPPADRAVVEASTGGPVLALRAPFDPLGLRSIRDASLGKANGVPVADRAFVLVAHRLVAPAREHGRAGRLETDFVSDRQGRRFVPHRHPRRRVRVHPRQWDARYRTRDQLIAATDRIEVALYHRPRDLFSLKPELVLSDLTSTSFEGTGPVDFAHHGSRRDGTPHNVQVIVGVVMVAGGPIAPHAWAGNRLDHGTGQDAVPDLRQRFEFQRLVFVGDRGRVTEANRGALTTQGRGFLVGLKRRRDATLDGWLDAVAESQGIDCPVGINARERKTNPPRPRAQGVPSGVPGMRGIVIDPDERRTSEQALRRQAMDRARGKLEALEQRVASGALKKPEEIAAAAGRIMQRYPGYRSYAWELREGHSRSSRARSRSNARNGLRGTTSSRPVSRTRAWTTRSRGPRTGRTSSTGLADSRTSWRCGRSLIGLRIESRHISLSPHWRCWSNDSSTAGWKGPRSIPRRRMRSKRCRLCAW